MPHALHDALHISAQERREEGGDVVAELVNEPPFDIRQERPSERREDVGHGKGGRRSQFVCAGRFRVSRRAPTYLMSSLLPLAHCRHVAPENTQEPRTDLAQHIQRDTVRRQPGHDDTVRPIRLEDELQRPKRCPLRAPGIALRPRPEELCEQCAAVAASLSGVEDNGRVIPGDLGVERESSALQ